ncbi:nitrilase-related carbon-nitrogen hydrolase [Vibrio gallaecicus]|uniref:carbon-nitrogen hydrolase family protein n=1 Tax=Vibrio gallaecicus TaxID=552386 RepID=UPI0015D2B074|nr:carbon-nitrogen hydrolase family protein [Vibrio gallaecicus]MDN3617330.1 carbon-nitrogen hydrolase family protein [Vibrio gallaecicus]
MKVGIAQMSMNWTVEENTKTICNIISEHRDLDILVFPELAITGFHREIKKQTQSSIIENALKEISTQCKKSKILAFIGYPLVKGRVVYNAYAAVNEQGCIEPIWCKIGLTEGESTFFKPGYERPVLKHKLGVFSTYLCREASDVSSVVEQLSAESPSYILWPSYIGKRELPFKTESATYDTDSAKIARSLVAMVIQCNWPHSLNNPKNHGLGGSKIISNNGGVIAQLPFDEVCVGVFSTTTQSFEVRKYV